MSSESLALTKAIGSIIGSARDMGLDPFPMRFEICPSEVLYAFGAYGVPTRFNHWSFGKAWHRIKTEYDYNLSRIYELVINTNPCYAFLLSSNSLVQNKLVVAHVLGHSDFFKHNAYFSHTPRDMLETMEASAARIRAYQNQYGKPVVEAFLDAALALQEHIDPCRHLSPARLSPKCATGAGSGEALRGCTDREEKRTGGRDEKDLLDFVIRKAPGLSDWQRDILHIVRSESLYFWPQIETKIINEGWATYWHLKIMRHLDLSEAEAFAFARMHAYLVQESRYRYNPYLLGLTILEEIENRYGMEMLFEVRATCNDISLIRNYLTAEVVRRLDLYIYQRVGHEWRVVEKDWEKVRETLVANLANGGHPYILVQDGDCTEQGDLYLRHSYEGVELDIMYLEKTMPHVFRLWSRPVHLETVIEEKPVVFTYDGQRVTRRFLERPREVSGAV